MTSSSVCDRGLHSNMSPVAEAPPLTRLLASALLARDPTDFEGNGKPGKPFQCYLDMDAAEYVSGRLPAHAPRAPKNRVDRRRGAVADPFATPGHQTPPIAKRTVDGRVRARLPPGTQRRRLPGLPEPGHEPQDHRVVRASAARGRHSRHWRVVHQAQGHRAAERQRVFGARELGVQPGVPLGEHVWRAERRQLRGHPLEACRVAVGGRGG